MQSQAHNTAFVKPLTGVSGEQFIDLTKEEQHATGIQIDITSGTTTGQATVQYTPMGDIVPTSVKRTPQDNVVDDSNGLTIWPIKCKRIWIDLTPAGAGPFDVVVVGYKA